MEQRLQSQFQTYNNLQKLQKHNMENPSGTKDEVTIRMVYISTYYGRFLQEHASIEEIARENKINISNEKYFKLNIPSKCQLLYLDLVAGVLGVNKQAENISRNPEENQLRPEGTSKENPQAVQMPKISLNKFSGKALDWIKFREDFHNKVALKTNLTNSQKFELLKSVLPKKTVLTFDTEVDHIKAMKILDEKFKTRILTAYLDGIVQHPKVDLSKDISELLDKTIKNLITLKSLNVNIHNWDVLLIHVLVTKLSDQIKSEWFDSYSCHESPKLYDFLKFLNLKHKEIDLRDQIETFNDYANCVCCEAKHPLWQCDNLKSMNNDKKWDFIRDKAICRRCFSSTHVITECQEAYTCRICLSRDHHFLLHKKN